MSGGCRFCDGTVAENVGLCSDCMSLLVEQNSNSLQHLQAKIAAHLSKLDTLSGAEWLLEKDNFIEAMRQLSAVQ